MNNIKNLLKRIKILKIIYRISKSIKIGLHNFFVSKAIYSDILCSLLLIFDKHQLLEYKRLLYGITIYKKKIKNGTNLYYFRRQLHRIEKGLAKKNRKKEFGLSYIYPTVKIYSNLHANLSKNREFLIYAYHVLSAYFSKTESNDNNYIRAYQTFMQTHPPSDDMPIKTIMRQPNRKKFIDLLMSRKSVRDFSPKVPEDIVFEYAVKCAILAPSGCNRQPYRFIVVKNKKLLKKLSSLPPGGGGNAFNASSIVFVIGDQSAFNNTTSSHEVYIDAALATMVFVLAIEQKGLSSCFMNWPHEYRLNKQAYKLLSLRPYEVIVTTIAVGYRDKTASTLISQRKSIEEVLTIL